MKLASFNHGRVGVVEGDGIVDVTDLVPGGLGPSWPSTAMPRALADLDALLQEFAGKRDQLPRLSLSEVALQAPVPRPGQLIALPANYDDHITEMTSPNRADRNGFFALAPSSISGPADPIVLPDLPGYTIDHECELAVIIGKPARHVRPEDAFDHIAGYACLVDVTVRGPQERAMRKSFPSFTPLGPYLVTSDEVGNPDELGLSLSVNGEMRHDGNTRDLIVGIADGIAMISSVIPLEPGDVIATGTPAGVGPLAPGDEVKIAVERVGDMTLQVVAGTGGYNIAYQNRKVSTG
ncbi:MAG: FAA hydrolase family protein [Rhodococcus sp. (in: high G+C Gram-positive bacteria)]|nr:MAG: FAA hydrolase family protein [Rhodococcus sp. (in: high G+C Gram-positive bacteria)]